MTLDAQLLQEAKDTRRQMIELEYEADRARLSFQHAVRRLHAAGGSLREIADALSVSHQRVHQIVEGTDGKVAIKGAHRKRSWRKQRSAMVCSFCGLPREEGQQMIAGPGAVYICETCVGSAEALASDPLASRAGAQHLMAASGPASQCSFCGKKQREKTQMIEAGSTRICHDCLELCDEILLSTGS